MKLRKFELVKKINGFDYSMMMGFMLEEFVEDWKAKMVKHYPKSRLILEGHMVEADYELIVVREEQRE